MFTVITRTRTTAIVTGKLGKSHAQLSANRFPAAPVVARVRAGLSRAPDPDRRSAYPRRLARHHCTLDRRGTAGRLAAAGGGREPARRQPEHRRRPGGEE